MKFTFDIDTFEDLANIYQFFLKCLQLSYLFSELTFFSFNEFLMTFESLHYQMHLKYYRVILCQGIRRNCMLKT